MVYYFNRSTALASLLLLSACQSTPALHKMEFPQTTVGLAVSSLAVETHTASVEDASAAWLDVPMTRQVEQWFRARYKSGEGLQKGTISVRKASFLETAASKQFREQYEMVLELRLEVGDDITLAKQYASARVQRSTPFLLNVTPAERSQAIQRLINETVVDADKELVRSIRSFIPAIITSQGSLTR